MTIKKKKVWQIIKRMMILHKSITVIKFWVTIYQSIFEVEVCINEYLTIFH